MKETKAQQKEAKAAAAAELPAAEKSEKEVHVHPKHEEETVPMLMVSQLEADACESISDPTVCMQKEKCFQDFIYGVCFFNCTTIETPEECNKHKFCRYETEVPANTCVNEGKLAASGVSVSVFPAISLVVLSSPCLLLSYCCSLCFSRSPLSLSVNRFLLLG